MKKISFEQLPVETQQALDTVNARRVLITRAGLPFAVITGVGFKDEEHLDLEESPEFWKMIQERRRETTMVPLEKIMAEITAEEQAMTENKTMTENKADATTA